MEDSKAPYLGERTRQQRLEAAVDATVLKIFRRILRNPTFITSVLEKELLPQGEGFQVRDAKFISEIWKKTCEDILKNIKVEAHSIFSESGLFTDLKRLDRLEEAQPFIADKKRRITPALEENVARNTLRKEELALKFDLIKRLQNELEQVENENNSLAEVLQEKKEAADRLIQEFQRISRPSTASEQTQ